jgi:hypothetical protein
VAFTLLADEARRILERRERVPVSDLLARQIEGRSGTLAVQAL